MTCSHSMKAAFTHQPNAVYKNNDAFYLASTLMVMRNVWPCFFRRDLCRGPFFMGLTDLHQSNILVDDDWNITSLIDLEWARFRSAEMIHPRYWLSNHSLGKVNPEDYESLRGESVLDFQEEEKRISSHSLLRLSSVMREEWERGTFWRSLALNCPAALFTICYDYLSTKFFSPHKDD